MLEHGGRLRQAAKDYGIALGDWLDLSTGINPETYPIPPLDPQCWNRLPEDDDGLDEAAAAYYGNDRLLALPGSQAGIQGLPMTFSPPATIAWICSGRTLEGPQPKRGSTGMRSEGNAGNCSLIFALSLRNIMRKLNSSRWG